MNKTYPTLFSRTSTGAVQEWTIIVEGEKYYTQFGQFGGKIQQTKATVALPKNIGKANFRTAEEQALYEAEALWKKKQKSEGYCLSPSDIDFKKFVEPMLAKNFKDHKKKITYPCYTQCKYNGGRCIATKDGLFTRKGEKYLSVPHIYNSLKEIFQKYPDIVIDGELMGDGFVNQLNETMKLIRRTVNITQEDLNKSELLVKYWIYDVYNIDDVKQSDGYEIRSKAIDIVVENNSYLYKVESRVCNNENDIYQHFQEMLDNNEEGSIIRLNNRPYVNKRSDSLLKMKPEDDDEAVIVDITEGIGNWAGTGKRITIEWQGKVFDATFKGTYEQAVKFLQEKDQWIGKTVTFLYNGFTGLGVPNFARIDINNCIKS